MRVAVVGSRSFNDYSFMENALDSYCKAGMISKIVSGGAKGADTLAKRYAKEHDIDFEEFTAQWDFFGKSAGYRRNIKIVDNSDMIVAFIVKGFENKGTNHTIKIAYDKGKDVVICEYEIDDTENVG